MTRKGRQPNTPHRGYYGPRRDSLPIAQRRLPPDQWPEAARVAWQRACADGGPLERPGKASHLAPASRAIREASFGRYLSYLLSTGSDVSRTGASRPTPERLAGYIESMRATLRASVIHRLLVDLSLVMGAIEPERDWKWIRRLPGMPTSSDVRASKRPIIPPDPFAILHSAYAACDAANSQPTPLKAAIQFRDGVLIALLTGHTPRLKNLSEMKVGTHLLIYETHLRLLFDGTVKNSEIIDVPLSTMMEGYMRRYITEHRPVLLRGAEDHQFLWVNIDGDPLLYSTIYQLIRKVTGSWGGRTGPQKMRHAAATTLMKIDPRQIEVASAVLAHRGTSTVNQVYDRSGGSAAQMLWLKMLKDKRLDKGPDRDDPVLA
jgi:integrase